MATIFREADIGFQESNDLICDPSHPKVSGDLIGNYLFRMNVPGILLLFQISFFLFLHFPVQANRFCDSSLTRKKKVPNKVQGNKFCHKVKLTRLLFGNDQQHIFNNRASANKLV